MDPILQAANQTGLNQASAEVQAGSGQSAIANAQTIESFEQGMTQTLFSLIMNLIMKEIGAG